MTRCLHRLAATSLLLAASLVGCPGSLENPDRFAGVTCGLPIDVEQDIFVTKCGDANCHGAGAMPAANLDLTSPGVAARLLDVPGSGCDGRALIQTEAPDGSALLDRLQEMPECGLRMPLGADALPTDEQNCVRAWVFEQATGLSAAALAAPAEPEGGP